MMLVANLGRDPHSILPLQIAVLAVALLGHTVAFGSARSRMVVGPAAIASAWCSAAFGAVVHCAVITVSCFTFNYVIPAVVLQLAATRYWGTGQCCARVNRLRGLRKANVCQRAARGYVAWERKACTRVCVCVRAHTAYCITGAVNPGMLGRVVVPLLVSCVSRTEWVTLNSGSAQHHKASLQRSPRRPLLVELAPSCLCL